MLTACSNNSSLDKRMSEADTVSTALITNPEFEKAKLVKTADMRFKVKNVQQTGDSIAALTRRLSGMVMHHQMGSEIEKSEDMPVSNDSVKQVTVYNTTADMTVQIPSEKLEDFMNRINHMATITINRKMDIEDKSFDYLSSKLKANNRKDYVARQDQNKLTTKNLDATLAVKDNLVDEQVNNLKTDAAVRYSVVALSFYQNKTISKEMIANDDPSAYHSPFFNRLLMAVANGWFMFAEVILGLANLWMFMLVAFGVWLLFRMYKRKYPALKV
jgi:hypothetical protein